MSDTTRAAQPDGGPVSSDPGYAASLGYPLGGPNYYAPPPPPVPPKKSHKLRNTLLGVSGLIVAIAVIASAAGGSKHHGGSSSSSGVSQGVASQDAVGDVKLDPVQAPDTIGVRYEKITVVNHSSKRSDYMIEVAVQSADGKTQYDTGTTLISNVDPGQTASDQVMFTKHIPAGAKVVLKTVERTASL
jgi:hypothetical protein